MTANGNSYRTNPQSSFAHDRIDPALHSYALCGSQEVGQDACFLSRTSGFLLRICPLFRGGLSFA